MFVSPGFTSILRLTSWVCILLVMHAFLRPVAAQTPAPALRIVIVEGTGAINNIRQRVAREPVVQVEDENNRPVAGAVVLFTLPGSGPSGTFANNATTFSTITDAQGRATGLGFRPNDIAGNFEIQVTANQGGLTATTSILQTNAALAAAGLSAKMLTILGIAAGAAAAAVIVAVSGGDSNGNAGGDETIVTPGGTTVGPPN